MRKLRSEANYQSILQFATLFQSDHAPVRTRCGAGALARWAFFLLASRRWSSVLVNYDVDIRIIEVWSIMCTPNYRKSKITRFQNL